MPKKSTPKTKTHAAKKDKVRLHLKLLVFFAFILAVSNALSAYIHSSYLAQFVGEKNAGLVFVVAYFFTLIAVNNFTSVINYLKIFKASLVVFAVMIAALFCLGISQSAFTALLFSVAYIIFMNLIWIALDIYLEYFSRDQMTGRIRGIYWTGYHIAWFISPLTSGLILQRFNYSFLFLIAAVLVIFVMFWFYSKFKRLDIDNFPRPNFLKAIKKVYKNKLIRGIFVIAFLLQVFYCAMLIYAPMYLHNHLYFTWQQIGWMFTAMLANFVIFTYPAGWLADKYFGEKEIISAGLLLMGVFTLIFGLIHSTNFWLWLIILFFTRVGASWVDIMRDTYFFKRVDVHDIDAIHLFRNTGSLAYILTPILAYILLQFFGYQSIFIVVGGLVLGGLWFSLRMKDTM